MTAINSNGLTKKYGDKTAFENLTFSTEGEKIIGLIGRNGAGKTAFLKTCAGYIRPTSGSVEIMGRLPFNNLKVLSSLVFIGGERQYGINAKLGELLRLGSMHYKNWNGAQAARLMDCMELDKRQNYKKLSGGMKSQFNIIIGICSRAPVTLMDEPTLGMDAAARKDFYNLLLEDYIQNPRTIIISSHLLSEVENLLSDILLMDEGRLIIHKPMEEMQEYAVYLNGKEDAVMKLLKGKKILYMEQFGHNVIVALHNQFSHNDRTYMQDNHIDVSKVNVQDLCIYLAQGGKEVNLHAV